ncbi:chemotaxis protein CheB [Caulobacter zeae]|uniref:protein-glutamate methylesterase n=1 Tax=Caulobacter zeae TaxID=2055137 RepID=A0A2N5DRQ4_9CAUL|nr:chemotaxis protein CheB [Caulobacter zeae]PLR28724.1 chemotaxis protein CheB [Caulobacter zeae]
MSASPPRVVVIGASAGAVQALMAILPPLPHDYRLPILVVVHVPPDRDNVLAPLLEAKCRLTVKEAEDKEPIAGGVVYLAPPDYHLLVETNGALALSADAPVNFSRPSIDILFESAADVFSDGLVGVVLTGANQDGAAGLRAVAKAGGVAIVENPASAQASAMPQAALAATPTAAVMSLDAIASYLLSLGTER